MPRKILLLLLTVIGSSSLTRAQFGFSHEVGAIAGPVMFMSDYGVRNDFKTNSGNTGYGIGLIHYLNFSTVPSVTVILLKRTLTITSN